MRIYLRGSRLLTARLMRDNRPIVQRRWRIMFGCLVAATVVLTLSARAAAASGFDWLQHHVLMVSILSGIATAAMVARHRTVARAEFARSWLAALPARRATARCEAVQIELLPAAVGMAALTGLMVTSEVILSTGGFVSGAAILIVWLWIAGGIFAGAVASYALPEPKRIDLPPGSRYVPKPPVKRGRVLPSLSSLGLWPVRQMFARAQPKLVARALMPVLLSIGLQSKADTALVAVGLFAALGGLTLFIPSVITVSTAAWRWLRPLPVSLAVLVRALSGRAVGVIIALSAAAGFLLPLIDASYLAAVCVAAMLALGSAALIVLGVWRRFSAAGR